MTSRYHVITTCNENGWRETGHRMVASFLDRWPAEIKLCVYAENFSPSPNDRLEIRRLPTWLDDFKRLHGKDPAKRGMRSGRYSFLHDAVKFSHKIAALTDFGSRLDDGIMVWLDADTFSHADVTAEWLDGLFPGKGYIAWLDRINANVETGFVMFRCEHRSHKEFMRRLSVIYQSGTLFRMPETHDAYVIAHLAREFMGAGMIEPPVSLSGDKGWHHPFVNGPLGACLDHMKGPRKAEGKSRRLDLRAPRAEPYWAS